MNKPKFSMLLDLLFQLAKVATIAFIGAMAVVLFVAVFYRYGLNNSIRWSEEAARALMVWMTFTAIPLAWRKSGDGLDEFVRVDLATRLLPLRVALLLEALCLVAILVFLALLGWKGLELAHRSMGQHLASIKISYFWIYLSIPAGCLLMCIATLERMAILLQNLGEADTSSPGRES